MKQFSRLTALAVLFALGSLAGCRNPESESTEATMTSPASQGAAGTGVGVRSTQGPADLQTGSSTQRTGTGYGGPIASPGPGQAGR